MSKIKDALCPLLEILKILYENKEYLTKTNLARLLDVHYSLLSNKIETLKKLGLVEEITIGKKGSVLKLTEKGKSVVKLYKAILEIIEENAELIFKEFDSKTLS